ncbi:hypothetical protein [Cellulosilyticum sp. WCF-2]|uniref:hypothetical protein n=1 Tax=Cellulosilyticum sp. WCF-2 TaxID=2497860 RepID=UPI000F8CD39F|nr:hypothetical protein [Cellulosilyticum sp. WCF-2]QEH69743.1 hypothetical protein EKH84_15615 [Cellulosilyticum sp. WCF-2]
MWMPCNFLETIKLREHMGYQLREYRLVGLTTTLNFLSKNGPNHCYVFELVTPYKSGKYTQSILHHMDLENNIAYWPNAFNNEDCYDPSTLNVGEIELKLNIDFTYQYNQYFFNTKSSAKGRLISLFYDQAEEEWRYTFFGSDGLAKYFSTKELLIKEPFRAYADDPLFD